MWLGPAPTLFSTLLFVYRVTLSGHFIWMESYTIVVCIWLHSVSIVFKLLHNVASGSSPLVAQLYCNYFCNATFLIVSSSSVERYRFFLEVWLLMNDFLQIFTYVVNKYIIYRKEIAKSWCILCNFFEKLQTIFQLTSICCFLPQRYSCYDGSLWFAFLVLFLYFI